MFAGPLTTVGGRVGAPVRHLSPLALGALFLALALWVASDMLRWGLLVAGLTLLFLVAGQGLVTCRQAMARDRICKVMRRSMASDPEARLLTDAEGRVLCATPSAAGRAALPCSLADALASKFADPDAVARALLEGLRERSAFRTTIPTRTSRWAILGHHAGGGTLLWHLRDAAEPDDRIGEALAVARIGTGDRVLAVSPALHRLLGRRPARLSEIVEAMPPSQGGRVRLKAADGPLAAQATVIDEGRERRLVLMPLGPEVPVALPEVRTDLDDLPVPLLRLDASGRVTCANVEARRFFDAGELEGVAFADMVEGATRPIEDWLRDALEGTGGLEPQFLHGRCGGQLVPLRVTLSRLQGAEGPCGVVVLSDLSEMKALEQQFMQSQKMQAIGQLAGGVAHDFNNLLTAISGHCDLLLLRHDDRDGDFDDLMQIRQNANRAASLVSQLLAFSRKQTLKPRVLDLRDTLADHANLLNRLVGEKIELVVRHDPALANLRADRRQLEQVIMNLVVNARDAMEEGGRILIETRTLQLHEPMARDRVTVPAGEYVQITVEDEGTGIAPGDLDKIFEPFFTTKRQGEGTGLGLSTAYGIVKQTGGFIFADRLRPRGTRFTLLFPSCHQPVSPEVEAASGEGVPARIERTGKGVVLLVEDEAPVRSFARRALQLQGFEVLEADCGETALKVLADPGLAIDVFVTDVIMPGKDGPTWVREALRDRPETRVIFVSGYAEDAFSNSAEPVPNAAFLPKPFSLNNLTQCVMAQMEKG